MALFLLVIYMVIFIVQIYLLVVILRKQIKKLWALLFSLELIPMLLAIGLMKYYDSLPGYGFMPGLCYLGEVLFSYGAAVLYGVCFFISVCICFITGKNR